MQVEGRRARYFWKHVLTLPVRCCTIDRAQQARLQRPTHLHCAGLKKKERKMEQAFSTGNKETDNNRVCLATVLHSFAPVTNSTCHFLVLEKITRSSSSHPRVSRIPLNQLIITIGNDPTKGTERTNNNDGVYMCAHYRMPQSSAIDLVSGREQYAGVLASKAAFHKDATICYCIRHSRIATQTAFAMEFNPGREAEAGGGGSAFSPTSLESQEKKTDSGEGC